MAPITVVDHPEAGVCLALLRYGLDHGYVIAQEFASDGDVGVVLTVSRPVVYRELAALESRGLMTSRAARGVRGQAKKTLKLTAAGNKALDRWLEEPVTHIREMRTEFLLKVLMREKLQMEVAPFVSAQREALADVTTTLAKSREQSLVTAWRREQARAVVRFLDELEGRETTTTVIDGGDAIPLSARNQLQGTVLSVQHGDILSSVKIVIAPQQVMTSTITREATESLRLAPGASVTALCKATDVLLGARQDTD
ncbi:MAG: TOBE domain-containing protein [Ilumatobacteraceae bacterium]